MIDTVDFAERLEREYGDDPERARRHARILGDMVEGGEVATRRDILRTDMQHEIGTLRSEIREMGQRLCVGPPAKIAGSLYRPGLPVPPFTVVHAGAAPSSKQSILHESFERCGGASLSYRCPNHGDHRAGQYLP